MIVICHFGCEIQNMPAVQNKRLPSMIKQLRENEKQFAPDFRCHFEGKIIWKNPTFQVRTVSLRLRDFVRLRLLWSSLASPMKTSKIGSSRR